MRGNEKDKQTSVMVFQKFILDHFMLHKRHNFLHSS